VTVVAAAPAADTVVTGVLGFLVVAGMGLALFFLLRSMNKQLRKVAPGPKRRPARARPGPGSGRQRQAVGEQGFPGPGATSHGRAAA
jgi:hypothetical protein